MEKKTIPPPNFKLDLVIAGAELLALLFRMASSLILILISAWVVRYFSAFSFFEACVFSMGLWSLTLLFSLRGKLNHLHQRIEEGKDFYDEYEEKLRGRGCIR